MSGKILVLKGMSRYNVLRQAADEMVEGFINQGFKVVIVDLTLEDQIKKFPNFIFEDTYDLIFSFQAIAFEIRLKDNLSSFLNALNIPIFGYIVDFPVYHDYRIAPMQGDNMYFGFIDRSHVDYVHKYYPHVVNAYYLPHGGFEGRNIKHYNERTIDLYFPSSYTSPEEIMNQINELPTVYKNISNLIIPQLLEHPLLTLQDALANYLEQVKFTYTSEEFTQIVSILYLVDQYIRTYTRDKLVRYLLNNQINLTVSGTGWEHFVNNSDNHFTVLASEGLDIIDTLEIMGNSKMVLNNTPTYQDGMHERIFSSMRCGAILLTNDFPCIHEEFTPGENILLYSDADFSGFADQIQHLLSHPEEAQSIANNGKQIADASHSWSDRAKNVLELVGLIKD